MSRLAVPWKCSQCGQSCPGNFAVCWNCGTTKDGQPDPTFVRPQTRDDNGDDERPWSPPQIALRDMLLLTTLAAISFGLCTAWGPGWGISVIPLWIAICSHRVQRYLRLRFGLPIYHWLEPRLPAADRKLPTGERPNYFELGFIVALGMIHVLAEMVVSPLAARLYNVVAAVACAGYVVWRARHTKDVVYVWGMRRDNFWAALRVHSPFVVSALFVMLTVSWYRDTGRWPLRFWTVPAYILWGTAQQFALQNLLARNLRYLIHHAFVWSVASGLIFGLSHFPRLQLVALAALAGCFLTWGYRRQPNLWAVGLIHGILGTVAQYGLFGGKHG